MPADADADADADANADADADADADGDGDTDTDTDVDVRIDSEPTAQFSSTTPPRIDGGLGVRVGPDGRKILNPPVVRRDCFCRKPDNTRG